MKTYTFTEYDLYDLISDARDTISRAKSAKDIIATLTPSQPTVCPDCGGDWKELIARLNALTARANHELQKYGEWQIDYGPDFRELQDKLDRLANRQGGQK